jgi:hypothetical protein
METKNKTPMNGRACIETTKAKQEVDGALKLLSGTRAETREKTGFPVGIGQQHRRQMSGVY